MYICVHVMYVLMVILCQLAGFKLIMHFNKAVDENFLTNAKTHFFLHFWYIYKSNSSKQWMSFVFLYLTKTSDFGLIYIYLYA